VSDPSSNAFPATPENLLKTPLHGLHVELGARMVPFAGYSMPVQYPAGLMAEHHHTRSAAGLFDVSHMGQLCLVGPDSAAALETLIPVDVIDLPVGRQRYGLLLNDDGGIIDDLMFFNRDYANHANGGDIFIIVNGACKVGDIAHIQQKIGTRCKVIPMPERALLALQGPQAVTALQRLAPSVEKLVFMSGGRFTVAGCDCFLTRSGYTGEDGFEISVHASQADTLARALLAQPEVKPIGLGARNSLRLEAGLCLYGNDIDTSTTPVEANLNWAIQRVRRSGGARAGGFPGAKKILAQLTDPATTVKRKRVGLVALERIPVRDHSPLQSPDGAPIGEVTSGLLGPTINTPVAMGYVKPEFAALGTLVNAMVRGKPVPMEVTAMPFVPNHYYRG
jgi:aminomethyltransferase